MKLRSTYGKTALSGSYRSTACRDEILFEYTQFFSEIEDGDDDHHRQSQSDVRKYLILSDLFLTCGDFPGKVLCDLPSRAIQGIHQVLSREQRPHQPQKTEDLFFPGRPGRWMKKEVLSKNLKRSGI
jgi:hypothetical protein